MIRHILNSRRRIKKREAKLIALLGLPTFGLALSISAVVTYAPLLAHQYISSAVIIGLIIGTEGLMALFLPVIIGHWSDNLRTRLGGRLPFVLIGGPLSALALVCIGLSNSLALLIVSIAVFFFAYYVAYEPYRALYPDLISKRATSRAQGVQALWRGAGTGLALIIGGPLIVVALWLPFVMAAFLVLVSIACFLWFLLKQNGVPKQSRHKNEPLVEVFKGLWRLLIEHGQIRNYIIANMLWELSLAALKTFIILYLTLGMGFSTGMAALLIALVAVFIGIGSPISGILADHFGRVKVMTVAVMIFGVSLLLPSITDIKWLLAIALPVGGLSGAIVMTLPYALLIPMMPSRKHGRLTGLYSTSRGVGIMLGPILAGAAISIAPKTYLAHGFAAMWLVCGGAMLLSLLFLRQLDIDS
ncbi:MAG TPA: MFS transporter [Candidatus Saccharimonadales bacterium]|nr:MFS transporter [Candidatus Saccharimonadales bacterium]